MMIDGKTDLIFSSVTWCMEVADELNTGNVRCYFRGFFMCKTTVASAQKLDTLSVLRGLL